LFFPVLAMVAYGLGTLLDMELTDYFIKFEPFWLIGFLFVIPLGGYEEFGWRGLMQKELQKKFSPLVTFLIVAFFWNAWHLPMHYNGYYSEGGVMDLLPALVFTIPLTIIIGWLYNVSRYSLIAVILLHTSNNTFQDVFGSSFFLFFVLMVLFSIFLVIKHKMWKKQDFSANLE
jgi:membrane protease YdiL (CAAX protease family)